MLDQLVALLSLLSWAGGIALVLWWLCSVRRARTAPPPLPRPEDQAEIARLRAHLGTAAAAQAAPSPDPGQAGVARR